MSAQLSHYETASAQVQLAACVKAATDLCHKLHRNEPGNKQIDAAIAAMHVFDAILKVQINGATNFPPALKPLERAMNDVLTQAGHELTQSIPDSTEMHDVIERLEEGQAAITQASIAGFMMLTHLSRALAARSTAA